jgi:hypothetical protein
MDGSTNNVSLLILSFGFYSLKSLFFYFSETSLDKE